MGAIWRAIIGGSEKLRLLARELVQAGGYRRALLAPKGPVKPTPELSWRLSDGYAPAMPRHLFRRLRRCRALFALALCAWLTLASAAWAQEGCCTSMGSLMSMTMHHAADTQDQSPGHSAATTPDCACAHATAQLPSSLAQGLAHALPLDTGWTTAREAAPQPVYEPLLRPPVA